MTLLQNNLGTGTGVAPVVTAARDWRYVVYDYENNTGSDVVMDNDSVAALVEGTETGVVTEMEVICLEDVNITLVVNTNNGLSSKLRAAGDSRKWGRNDEPEALEPFTVTIPDGGSIALLATVLCS